MSDSWRALRSTLSRLEEMRQWSATAKGEASRLLREANRAAGKKTTDEWRLLLLADRFAVEDIREAWWPLLASLPPNSNAPLGPGLSETTAKRSLLTLAVSYGAVRCTEALLQAGADPNQPDRNVDVALTLACSNEAAATLVPLLLAQGANASHPLLPPVLDDIVDNASLSYDDKVALAQHLRPHWSAARWEDECNRALLKAVEDDDEALVAWLLANGASVRPTPELHWRREVRRLPEQPLTAALDMDRPQPGVVRRLLAAGADPTLSSARFGANALMVLLDHCRVAVSAEHLEILHLLLQQGIPLTAADAKGDTALHYAVDNDRDESIVPLLLRAGALLEAANSRGRTPLWTALENGALTAAAQLVAAGANLDATCPERPALTARQWIAALEGEPSAHLRALAAALEARSLVESLLAANPSSSRSFAATQ